MFTWQFPSLEGIVNPFKPGPGSPDGGIRRPLKINADVAGSDSRFTPQSPAFKTRLAAADTLCGHGKSWHRTWVPRLWDQRSQSCDPLRPTETALLSARRRDHRAVLTINGLLQGNRYKAGLRSNHPYVAHRSSRYRPMPVSLVDHRFRDALCCVAR